MAAKQNSDMVNKCFVGIDRLPPYRVKGPTISAIIPTFNEQDYLPYLLTSVENQTLKPSEIIVADYNSTDETKQIAKSFGAKIVNVGERGPGIARYEGAKHATGDLLFFSDADNILEHELIEKLSIPLVNGSAIASHPKMGIYDDYIAGIGYSIFNWVRPTWYTTRCVLVDKNYYNAVGGYRNIWREDLDLGKRIYAQFGENSIAHVSDAVLVTTARRMKAQAEHRVKEVQSPYFPAVRDGIYRQIQ